MDVTPHSVRTTSFKTARKGYDTAEVDRFKESVAAAIEQAQNQATAMEARARAAVARLQEISQAGGEERPAAAAVAATATASDHEAISKTLLVAQRTADNLVGEAKAEANHLLDSARAQAAQIVEDAKVDARREFDGERLSAQNEVQALLAKRDFLLGDAEQLEGHVVGQRARLQEVSAMLAEIADRPAGGLGEVRLPLLSAAADDSIESGSAGEEPRAPVADGTAAISVTDAHPSDDSPS